MPRRTLIKPDKSSLKRLCETLTNQEVAQQLGCNVTTINRWKREYKLINVKCKKGKLSRATAKRIRQLYDTDNYTQARLAEMFGVTQAMIGRIINNKAYVERYLGFQGGADVQVSYNA